MGSVTVIGTSTMSTFILMSAPGRALFAAAPVTAGASVPLGAPVSGVEDDGGGTCTLFSGSSCACARRAPKPTPNPHTQTELASAPTRPRRRSNILHRLRCILIPVYLRLWAIVARLVDGWRHRIVINLSQATWLLLSSEPPNRLRHWVTIKPKRETPSVSFLKRKFRRFNGEQDIPHGQYLSIPRVAVQSFNSPIG